MGPNSSTGSFFGQKVSKQGVNVNTAGDSELLYKMDYGNSNEIWYDNSDPRVILGKLPDGTYGLKVSIPGYDVTTATDNQLAFSSEFVGLRVVASGKITINMPFADGGDAITVSTPHGLGGPKMLIGYVNVPWDSASFYMQPLTFNTADGVYTDWSAKMWVTATDVVAEIISTNYYGNGPEPWDKSKSYNGITNFKWYLLQETAN